MENSKYSSLSHNKTRLRYYFVFSTKYRRKCFDGIERQIKDCFSKAVQRSSKLKLLAFGVDRDHIHIVVSAPPSLSVAAISRQIKQLTTRYAWETCESHLSNFYWGNKAGKLWSSGYFCETVGNISEDKVLSYVENQGNMD